ncbi:MAG: hypothetical protein QM534_11305 [Sediminibacterium sp.]|nr:hypothetical protein [Sediminibacterium sp.]
MKKTIVTLTTLTSSILLVTGLSLSSCKKGETGPQGPAGTNGTNGINGNANVVSHTFTVTAASWTATSGNSVQYTEISDNTITKDIVEKGVVLVYMMSPVSGGYSAAQLPLTMYPGTAYAIKMEYTASVNKIAISIMRSDIQAPSNPGTLIYKIVKIPASARLQNPGLNYQDYITVKKAFHLVD